MGERRPCLWTVPSLVLRAPAGHRVIFPEKQERGAEPFPAPPTFPPVTPCTQAGSGFQPGRGEKGSMSPWSGERLRGETPQLCSPCPPCPAVPYPGHPGHAMALQCSSFLTARARCMASIDTDPLPRPPRDLWQPPAPLGPQVLHLQSGRARCLLGTSRSPRA